MDEIHIGGYAAKFSLNLSGYAWKTPGYKGENYVPEDYQHEDLRDMVFTGHTDLHFRQNELQSIDLYLHKVSGKMNLLIPVLRILKVISTLKMSTNG